MTGVLHIPIKQAKKNILFRSPQAIPFTKRMCYNISIFIVQPSSRSMVRGSQTIRTFHEQRVIIKTITETTCLSIW